MQQTSIQIDLSWIAICTSPKWLYWVDWKTG